MISLIAAIADNGVIGNGNELPWHLPRDLKNFKALTTGHPCIMGRKTYESIVARIGKPLPNRKNVVITRQVEYVVPDGVQVVRSFEEAMQSVGRDGDAFVIGGAEVYRAALSFVDRLYLTRVHLQAEGSILFPDLDLVEWRLQNAQEWELEQDTVSATFEIYERKQ